MPPNAAIASLVGAGYALVGVVSAAITLGSGLAGAPGAGGLRTPVYLTAGLVLLCAVVRGRAKLANSVLGGLYVAAGMTLALRADAPQLFALDHPDNVVHLCTAALLVGFGRTQD